MRVHPQIADRVYAEVQKQTEQQSLQDRLSNIKATVDNGKPRALASASGASKKDYLQRVNDQKLSNENKRIIEKLTHIATTDPLRQAMRGGKTIVPKNLVDNSEPNRGILAQKSSRALQRDREALRIRQENQRLLNKLVTVKGVLNGEEMRKEEALQQQRLRMLSRNSSLASIALSSRGQSREGSMYGGFRPSSGSQMGPQMGAGDLGLILPAVHSTSPQ